MYYVVPLTNDEVSGGVLFKIQDYLVSQSDDSMKKIREGAHGLMEKDIIVFYDNGQGNPMFYEKWGDNVHIVAYMNELAYQLLSSKGVIPSSLTVDQLPDNLTISLHIPYYS